MKKTKMTTKALSMFLSVIMLFTMISVGIIVPETKADAAETGETIEVSTVAQLNEAIGKANTAGVNKITTIKLKGNITYENTGGTSLAAFTTISSANVVLDMCGYYIKIKVTKSGDWGSDDKSVQLPSGNAGSFYTGTDTLTSGMFNISAGSTLQIISSSNGGGSMIEIYTDIADDDNNNGDDTHHQTSSSAIYCEGTLIIGDPNDSTKNDVNITAKSYARNTNKSAAGLVWNQVKKSASANAYGVTLNSDSAIFKMYGGTLQAAGIARVHRSGSGNLRIYALNANNCYSAEIYGGEISIPNNIDHDEATGLRQSETDDSGGSNSIVAAIRCNTTNLYIFDVNSNVYIKCGSDSGQDCSMTAANVYATSGKAATIYGGNYYYNCNSANDTQSATVNCYTIYGPYNIATDKQIKKEYETSKNGQSAYKNTKESTFVCYTLFVHGGANSENGLNIFSFNTFRQYLEKLSTATDVYAGTETATHHNDGNDYTCSTHEYLRNGYTHTGWIGKSHPSGGLSYSKTSQVPLNAANGGSLFIEPVWTENEYEIHYDYNDSEGATRVTDTSSCPQKYKIASTPNAKLGTPVRPGYKFVEWEITAYDYPETDTKKPWSLGTYPPGFSLNGRNGEIWLKAIWEVIDYTATFEYDTEYNPGDLQSTSVGYDVNGIIRFPAAVEIPNYTFTGYYRVKTASGSWQADNTLYKAGESSSIGSYGNPVFEAIYTPNDFEVNYNSKGGTSVDSHTYNIESGNVLPEITKNGNDFKGWRPSFSNGNWSGAIVYPAGTEFKGMYGDVDFEAVFEGLTYTVTLDLSAGGAINGSTQITYSFDSALSLNVPTRTGYTYKGWRVVSCDSDVPEAWGKDGKTEYLAEEVNGKVELPSGKVGNVTLEPIWEANTYELTFNSNGGTGCDPIEYTIETQLNLPVPTKAGYSFGGWELVTSKGNWTESVYSAGNPYLGMYGDTNFVAIWNKTQYTVTLDTLGGNVAYTSFGYNFESEPVPPIATKNGYTFSGWIVTAKSEGASWEIDKVYLPGENLPLANYGNLTLTAIWTATVYNIHFSSKYGAAPEDMTYTIDDETLLLRAASSPGYEFKYWIVAADSGSWKKDDIVYANVNLAGGEKKFYGNVSLTAEFEAINYTVTFKDIDSTETVVNYDMSTGVTVPDYNRDGYVFKGWNVVECTGGGWNSPCLPGEIDAGTCYGNVVLEPILTEKTYEIVFIPDGGTPYPNEEYTITSTIELPTPEKTGYDFKGWKITSSEGNWVADSVVDGGSVLTSMFGNVTLTATWAPKEYKITWITGNGTFETYVKYGSMPDDSTINKTKDADAQYTYTFSNWSPSLTIVKGEATYEAQYTKTVNYYDVTWVYEVSDTETKTETVSYAYGAHPIFNNGINPEKTVEGKYFRFVGWYDGTAYIDAATIVTGEVTYTAVYKEIEAPRTVTWIIDGVRQETKWSVDELPQYVGTPIKADANGIKYTFSHWTPSISVVESGKDYEYVAVFTESYQTYTATFDLNGGSYEGNLEVTYNKNSGLTMPQPVKTGYIFNGWRVVSNDGLWTSTDLYIYTAYLSYWGNVSFIAEYETAEYTIKVNADDGTTPEYKYTIESTDTLPELTKEGYVLSAWTIVMSDGNWIIGDTVQADKLLTGMYGNVTILPIWSAKLYKINWVSDGYTQTVEFRFGETIVAYPPISKAGYTAQWDAEVPVIMPAEDLTFTAIYSPIQYYLRFNVAGGSAVENFYYDITSTTVLPTPTREGATFKGWKVAAGNGNWKKNENYLGGTSLNGLYGNVTLTAVWEIQLHTVTWIAGDVTKITKWYHGAVPSYDGVPYKSPDDYNSYVFIGWDKEITTVTKDVVYTAQFKATQRIYVVVWSIDGYNITENYLFGQTPVYTGETPVRPSTQEFDFTFAGWTPEISTVTGDITYVAQFDVFTKLQGLRVDKSAVFLNIGEEAVVSVILSPTTATNKDVEWTSADENIAVVDPMGRITAVGAGDVVLCVQSKDGAFKSYCVVKVAPITTQYIVVSAGGVSTTRLPGDAIQLTAIVMPENATNKNVKWSSSNTAVAMVDANGLVVFGEVTGTAVITASSDGYATGTIEVTTTTSSADVEDTVKTYMVMFAASTSTYIIAGNTYESINIICKEGDTVEFLLTEPHFVMINGVKMERDTDGVFRIKDIHQNYSIMSVERADIGLEEDNDDEPAKVSFFDKLKDFFRSIIEFFKNLFG